VLRLPKYPRNVWFTTIGSFLTDVSSEMIVYLVPIFLAVVLRTPTPYIGLIEGVAETTASFTKLFSGYISDRLHNRKWLTVSGYSLSTLAKVFLALAGTWQAVFGARFVDRLGKGLRTAPRDALIADSVDEKTRGAAFGFHRAGDTLGAFVGVGLAIVIIQLTQQQAKLLTRKTFDTVVLVSLIPAVLAVLVLALGLRETRAATVSAPPVLSLRGFDDRFKFFLLVVGIFTLGNSADAFIVLRAQDRGASLVQTLLMVMGFNLVYTLAAQPLGRLSDRIGRRPLLIAGWLLYAFVYLGFALSDAAWSVAAFWLLYGLFYALTEGAARAFIADLVPAEKRGTAYGLYNATIGFLVLPASLIAGILWQAVGPAVPFILGALMALCAAALLTIHLVPRHMLAPDAD
jgi:MFS family permease